MIITPHHFDRRQYVIIQQGRYGHVGGNDADIRDFNAAE
ncbi:hypothetical protein KSP9073_02902 [Kushneria phyllosphaerae]|uniref:Uncharacterized protein n=1 Tax=Kushneria phyllosphaerae TaxID=2100822 RepID=A0A2R8CPN7_9GAMM|nr:hypothetical protein KSP9073_02902 [Kushneria phyllosphaerae]